MTTHTSYRIRMRTRAVDNIAETMLPVSNLSTMVAREPMLSWWDTPALFGYARTFGPYIPDDQPKGPAFWSWDGTELVLAIDTIGMDRVDGVATGTHGRSVVLDVLSSLCDEAEGTIVGGMQDEHSDDWRPVILHDGRLRIGYVAGSQLGDKERQLAVQPRVVEPWRITASADDTVSVSDVD